MENRAAFIRNALPSRRRRPVPDPQNNAGDTTADDRARDLYGRILQMSVPVGRHMLEGFKRDGGNGNQDDRSCEMRGIGQSATRDRQRRQSVRARLGRFRAAR